MNKYKQCDDALNAISQLSQAPDQLLGNLLRVTEEFPKESLVRDPAHWCPSRFDVIGVTVFKEYHQGARPTYRIHDDTAWRTLAEALATLDQGEFRTHIRAEPVDEYARRSFDYEGHEFMCLMLREQAERLGYIEPEQQVIKEG